MQRLHQITNESLAAHILHKKQSWSVAGGLLANGFTEPIIKRLAESLLSS